MITPNAAMPPERRVWYALSADKANWPTEFEFEGEMRDIINGSWLIVIDAPAIYSFDAENKEWCFFAGTEV